MIVHLGKLTRVLFPYISNTHAWRYRQMACRNIVIS